MVLSPLDFGGFLFDPATVLTLYAQAIGAGVTIGALAVLMSLFYGGGRNRGGL